MKKVFLFILAIFFCIPLNLLAANVKVALIIGNSNYQHLSKLNNTINDAKAIQKSLNDIGFKTTIATDITSEETRKQIRKFSLESKDSPIALIFYAGHGAQVFGENYLLPTDMEIPKIESDIQLTGISVDSLLNSLGSKTKIVFLDACRDNPALIKSLSKGRGSYQNGLAAAKVTTESSSGVFIAYATDAGNVALDGSNSENSPFTTALLKNIKKPISIDDMFSMVTNDVRIITKNKQRPYKYASLNGVVCLTNKCAAYAYSDNQDDNLDIASQLKNKENKIAMIDNDKKNQNTSINEIDSLVMTLSKEDFEEADDWILVNQVRDPTNKSSVYVKPSSIKREDDIARISVKFEKLNSGFFSKGGSYDEIGHSFDCKTKKGSAYFSDKYDKNGKLYDSYQFHDPSDKSKMTLDFSSTESKGTVGSSLFFWACNPEKLKPFPEKKNLQGNLWKFAYQTSEGSGFHVYKDSIKNHGISNDRDIDVGFFYKQPIKLADTFLGLSFKGYSTPMIKKHFQTFKILCAERKYIVTKEAAFYENDKYVFAANGFPEQFKNNVDDAGLKFVELFDEVCK